MLAAASLAHVLPDALAGAGHPTETVFAGSADLVAQVVAGATVDVVVTADRTTMSTVVDAGLVVGTPSDLATNRLAVVTAPGTPHDVTGLADLADPGLAVVVCAPQVPCGRATAALAAELGVTLDPRSEESSVTGVLTKVRAGEADAGVVYVTDARRAGDDVVTIDLPDVAAARTTYQVAVVARGGPDARDQPDAQGRPDAPDAPDQPDPAAVVVAHLLGPDAQRVLADAGFGPP